MAAHEDGGNTHGPTVGPAEGDNQKQADFLSRSLAAFPPAELTGLHLLLCSISRPEHLDMLENGVAERVDSADATGNLYTGSNTEDTPAVVEATAFRDGIVVAQVNRITDELPRVDVPGSWVDLIVEADRPYRIDPLFTRDPQRITDSQILQAMLALRGEICRDWILNPHPTLIPAIETTWVRSVTAFGGKVGMNDSAATDS